MPRVLIADDEDSMRTLVARPLRQLVVEPPHRLEATLCQAS